MYTRRHRPTSRRTAGRRALTAASDFKAVAALRTGMPKTEELECVNPDCELDMFENHYTYDVPDDLSVSDLQCPYCGETEWLEKIEL